MARPRKEITHEVDAVGCWNCTSHAIGTAGYPLLKRGRKQMSVARFICQKNNPDLDIDGLVVMHSCDNKRCINPAHLSFGTDAQNIQDAIKHGLWSHSKLTEEQVRSIRSGVLSSRETAKIFGVSQSRISQIRSGKRWTWVRP